jgi:copper chaperone CopZ
MPSFSFSFPVLNNIFMKSLKFMLMAAFAMLSPALFAQQTAQPKTDTIKVYGACGMCQSRIQKALKLDGITAANWSTATKLLTITYLPEVIGNDAIQKKVAAAGHDTDKYRADDKVYDKLPGCCRYERKKVEVKQDYSQHP